ncbi:Hypothetical protein (plasmid) [Pseudomonas putida]|nr:Hypothetical protein [Pseudomonas putida]
MTDAWLASIAYRQLITPAIQSTAPKFLHKDLNTTDSR